ncbi:MAG: LytTR family DNA-binding domain-containing protein [Pseudomonadota bacterium]
MNRLLHYIRPDQSADALRLWALMAVLATVSQLNEALVDATLGQQVVYWGVRLTVFSVSLFSAQWLIDTKWPNALRSPSWLKPVVIVSALAIVPFTLVELFLESQLPMVPAYDDDDLMAISPMLAFAAEYGTNATIVMPLHFLVWLLVTRHAQGAQSQSVDANLPVPTFLTKTHGIRVEEVVALKAEEHYVRVYTQSDNELVHQKFGSAITQMPPSLGLQVHRSWWVANHSVVGAKRGARRWQLTLINDLDVPVSDGFIQSVRTQGLLKRKSRQASQ